MPQQRVGKAGALGGAAVVLPAGDAGYITRQVLPVNGGLC